MKKLVHLIANEEGHARPVPGIGIAGAGVILLGVGAANDTGWLAITGGIVAAIGMVAWDLLRHTSVDYDIYRRLEDLEKNR